MEISLIQFRYAQALDIVGGTPRRVVATDDLAVVEQEISSDAPAVIVIGEDASGDEVNAIRSAVLGKRACFVLVRAGDTPASIVRLVRYGIRRLV